MIGTLSGGIASCGDSIGYDIETDRVIYNLAPNRDDYFSRFGMAWDYEEYKGNALKPWLDPLNSGTETLGGYNPTSAEPLKVVSGKRFRVFPNPAGELFHITSKEPIQDRGSFTLLNLSGALLFKGELDGEGRAEIHTANMAPGLYLIHIEVDNYQEHHKLLVVDP